MEKLRQPTPLQWEVLRSIERLTRELGRPPRRSQIRHDLGIVDSYLINRLDSLGRTGWIAYPVDTKAVRLLVELPPEKQGKGKPKSKPKR